MTLFLLVIDSGSFSAAARRTGQTPSAVGKRIRALEERLGVDLLVRSTRKMALTAAGQRYAEDAREIVARMTALEEDLREGSNVLRGMLRMTAPTAYGQRFVVPAVAAFMASHPAVEVHLMLTDKNIDLVGEGIDLAVRTGSHPDSTLISRRIGPYGRKICAAPSYLERHGRPRAVLDVTSHRCLRLPSEATVAHWGLQAAQNGIRLGRGFICNSLDALSEACIAGQGLACLPDFIADALISDGQLTEVLSELRDEHGRDEILLLRPANAMPPRRVRALSDALFSHLRQS